VLPRIDTRDHKLRSEASELPLLCPDCLPPRLIKSNVICFCLGMHVETNGKLMQPILSRKANSRLATQKKIHFPVYLEPVEYTPIFRPLFPRSPSF
jgi:hypothetical protein